MRSRSDRSALLVFVAVEVVAAAFWVSLGARGWFGADEWDFIADRDGGDLGDLMRPHNEHWSTIPIVIYRVLWHLVGLRSYIPYVIPVIAAHLAVAALLRVIMRRGGVDPWIATAAASAFVFFGAGSFNIIYAFQIGFTGALAVGLTALLIADRDGGPSRADVAGVLCCIASLMFAGVSVILVACVTLAVLLRRGVRVAALYAVPSAVIFVVWAYTTGRDQYDRSGTPDQVARFVEVNLRTTFGALGKIDGVGLGLAMILVVGLVIALRAEPGSWRHQLSAPLSLLVGALGFALTTGLGRGATSDNAQGLGADASRYLHITAALLLPALAVAATAIAARWRFTLVPMILVFLVGIPLNVRTVHREVEHAEPILQAYRDRILVAARLPLADQLPPSASAEPHYAPSVTIEWLQDGVASGRIPRPVADPDVDLTALVVDLVLPEKQMDADGLACVPLGQAPTALEAGQVLAARGPVVLNVSETPSSPAGEVELYFLTGFTRKVAVDGLSVGLSSGHVQVCET